MTTGRINLSFPGPGASSARSGDSRIKETRFRTRFAFKHGNQWPRTLEFRSKDYERRNFPESFGRMFLRENF